MTQPTDEAPDPELTQIIEQLDRIEATLDTVAAAVASEDDPEPPVI
jgi:hypothetical protein